MKNLNTRAKISAGLGALVLCSVFAVPAFAQQTPRACIHFQTACSDNPYAAATTHTRPLYNVAQETGFTRACIHFQTACSDNPYPSSGR